MAGNALPEPLVPSACDLRGFSGFMLDVDRLLASELVALGTPEECWAAVMLWCRAWKQSPPGSLPNDDRVLAAFSGAGTRWRKVKAMALRGFVPCSDGRLYHRVLAAEAEAAWRKRRQYQDDQERLRRWRTKDKGNGSDQARETVDETPAETVDETRFKTGSETRFKTGSETRFKTGSRTVRQGQGQGQGQVPPPTPPAGHGGPDGRAVAEWFEDATQPHDPVTTPELRERALAASAAADAAFERVRTALANRDRGKIEQRASAAAQPVFDRIAFPNGRPDEPDAVKRVALMVNVDEARAAFKAERERLVAEFQAEADAEYAEANRARQDAMAKLVPGLPTSDPHVTIEVTTGKRCAGGYYLDATFDECLEAARINPVQWRGDQRPLVRWLVDGINPDAILAAIRRCAARDGYSPPFSLAWFDRPVREAARTNAA